MVYLIDNIIQRLDMMEKITNVKKENDNNSNK